MRFVGRSVRTSHNPSPNGRHRGMPTGHRHCVRNRSLPIACRSVSSNRFSHSRTGSLPPSARKKIRGGLFRGPLGHLNLLSYMYHRTYFQDSSQSSSSFRSNPFSHSTRTRIQATARGVASSTRVQSTGRGVASWNVGYQEPMMGIACCRLRVQLRGIVQGVGFRPVVHRLATERRLGGWVLNSSSGLVTEVEGDPAAVETFVRAIREEAPPLAWIQEMTVSDLEPLGESAFTIRESEVETGEFALMSPDVATCPDCVGDFTDLANRRLGYAFTNFTNCGSRYTIIQDIPYDRPKTTMAAFHMCAACQTEYDDPGDRRFHAQPNACPVCGPRMSAPVEEAQRRLAAGEIVAIKGLGGFHLACDAGNAEAVDRLRAHKRRSDKPFAVMVRGLAGGGAACD